MRYRSVQEEAAALEAVVADRYPSMSAEDRAMFPAAVLYKVTDLYRSGAGVRLEVLDSEGQYPTGGFRALMIENF